MLLFRFIQPAVKITNNLFTFRLCQKNWLWKQKIKEGLVGGGGVWRPGIAVTKAVTRELWGSSIYFQWAGYFCHNCGRAGDRKSQRWCTKPLRAVVHSATLQSVSRFQRGGLTGTFINVHLFLAATTGRAIYVLLRKNSPTWFAYIPRLSICEGFYIVSGFSFWNL